MSERLVIFESLPTGERYEVDLPLTSHRDPIDLRDELGLPTYIDPTEGHVARALAILWAAKNVQTLAADYPALSRVRRMPRVCLFGGIGYRFLCPSANESPVFQRQSGDLDLVTMRADGDSLLTLLSVLEEVLGNRYWHLVTKSDAMFNNLRAGKRYRIHALDENASSTVTATTLDILVDRIQFCHTIPVGDAFANPSRSLYTIGPAELLLTKLQFIRAVPDTDEASHHSHRHIGRLGSKLLIGPEDKDIADAAALLYDRGVGEESGQVAPGEVIRLLSADWGLGETIARNVANKVGFEHVLDARGAGGEIIDRVHAGLDALATVVEVARTNARRPRFRLSKSWWEVVEDLEPA